MLFSRRSSRRTAGAVSPSSGAGSGSRARRVIGPHGGVPGAKCHARPAHLSAVSPGSDGTPYSKGRRARSRALRPPAGAPRRTRGDAAPERRATHTRRESLPRGSRIDTQRPPRLSHAPALGSCPPGCRPRTRARLRAAPRARLTSVGLARARSRRPRGGEARPEGAPLLRACVDRRNTSTRSLPARPR